MAGKVHRIVEHSPNLDGTIFPNSEQQKVPRTTHTVTRRFDAIATVPKMISSRFGGDLRSCLAASAFRIIRHVDDSTDQKCLVTQACLTPEPIMSPCKNRLNILFGRR